MEMQKMKFQGLVYNPKYCMMKLADAQFQYNFPLHCLEMFLHTFSNAIQALSIEFNFVPKFASISCFICGPIRITFILALLILGNNFTLNKQTLRFIYRSLSRIFLSS
jgi:hypothetical protein